MAKKGIFIVLEGGEGSGKDTQIERLKERAGEDVVFTREPGGTAIGEEIRSVLLSKRSVRMSPKTELLLFLAARAQLLEEAVIPELEEGTTVISNRFGLSTVAYQIYGRERHEYLDFLEKQGAFVVGRYEPDLYLLLDVDPKVGLERVSERASARTRFDDESLAFHTRTREGYLQHITHTRDHEIIDANQTADAVEQAIHQALQSRNLII